MKLIVAKDYEELLAKAAEIMLGVVKKNPKAVLGLATGTTPLGLYAKMIADRKEKGTDYSQIRTVNLDEYKGLPKAHEQSYGKRGNCGKIKKNRGLSSIFLYMKSHLDAFRQKKFVITAIFIVKMKSCKTVFRKGDYSIFHRECHDCRRKSSKTKKP